MDTFPMIGIEIVLSQLNLSHLPVVWGSWPFVWKSSNYMLQCFLKERMQRGRKNKCGPPIDNNTARLMVWNELKMLPSHISRVTWWPLHLLWVLYFKLEDYSLLWYGKCLFKYFWRELCNTFLWGLTMIFSYTECKWMFTASCTMAHLTTVVLYMFSHVTCK